MAKPILLTHWRSPGDLVLMTGAVRDLARTFPGEFEIHVASSCPELWGCNPHVACAWGYSAPRRLPLLPVRYADYVAGANAGRQHFLTAFHRALSSLLKLEIPVLEPCGDLHLSDDERATRWIQGRYWLFVAGGKLDIRTKIWPAEFSQQLVDQLGNHGIRVVQLGAVAAGHQHPKLSGVEDLVGKTHLRDLLHLIQKADGVIFPVTCMMHMAAALHRPCVVIAGGREPPWWEWYQNPTQLNFGPKCESVTVPHRFLHTLGQLPCCEHGGCWKTEIQAEPEVGSRHCTMPISTGMGEHAPKCLVKITPQAVVDAVLSYYRDGTLKHLNN